MSELRYCLRLFGFTVAELVVNSDIDSDEVEDEPEMGGGSAHNFERDAAPLDIYERYAPWEDGFGFGPRVKGEL
jgi:hypothetical protein